MNNYARVFVGFGVTIMVAAACGDSPGGDGDGGGVGGAASGTGGSFLPGTGGDAVPGTGGAQVPGTGGDALPGTGGGVVQPPPVESVWDGEHAVGIITLGESHQTSANPTPFASASFAPNSSGRATALGCATELLGCRVDRTPDCGDACDPFEGQYCGFDDTCTARCFTVCDLACPQGQECYFPYEGSPACRLTENFDAGSLTFVGSPSQITLLPPYAFTGSVGAAPYIPGGAMSVVASGAAQAGFSAFEASFTATTLMQTSPALSTLDLASVFGSGDLTIGWVPGDDRIEVTGVVVTDEGTGTFRCPGVDAFGSVAVPRAVIEAAAEGEEIRDFTLTVTRRSSDITKGIATKGALVNQPLEAEGWVEVATSSAESYVFEGCDYGESICGSTCIDTLWDDANCGDCGVNCGLVAACSSGTCQCDDVSLTFCGGGCVDTDVDANHCGTCGNVCGGAIPCQGGFCTPQGGTGGSGSGGAGSGGAGSGGTGTGGGPPQCVYGPACGTGCCPDFVFDCSVAQLCCWESYCSEPQPQ